MLGNPNWKNEPLHALKLVLSAIKNKDTRKKYLSIYEDFVESLNFVSLKEKKITGLNSQNTPIPSNNIKDPLERQIQVFDYDADEYQIDLALQNLAKFFSNLSTALPFIKSVFLKDFLISVIIDLCNDLS